MKSSVTISLVNEARGGPFVYWADVQEACKEAKALGFTGIETCDENNFSVYPNPFAGKLNIEYTVQTPGHIRIVMYNSIGTEVGIIDEGARASGNHSNIFDGSNLPSGVYYFKFQNGETVKVAKVVKK